MHPKTGMVCVPINTRTAEDFDPLGVPTVTQLLGEIDAWRAEEGEDGKTVQDWEKTSLKPYVDYFRGFVSALLKDEKEVSMKREREETVVSADAMEF